MARRLAPAWLATVMVTPLIPLILPARIAAAPTPAVEAPDDGKSPARNIWTAADAGDVAAIKVALAAGADVNGQEQATGQAPLHRAALAGRAEAAKALLEAGADPNLATRRGYPPLAIAAEGGHLEIIRLLAKAGADLNAAPPPAFVPLAHAALENKLEAVKLLIELGADVNAESQSGLTALFSAAIRGRREAVKLLLDRGADVNHTNDDGLTAVSAAARGGDVAVLRLLLDAGGDARDSNDAHSAVCIAAEAGRRDAVLFLLDRGADVNVESNFEDSLLSIACAKGDSALARELLRRGAKSQPGDGGLEKALLAGHADCAQILLDQGATLPIEKRKEVAERVLKAGHLDAAMLLFRARAQWNGVKPGPEREREDALLAAARAGDATRVKAALDGGVDDAEVLAAALAFAQAADKKDAIDLLRLAAERAARALAARTELNGKLTAAAEKGDAKRVKALLDAGADGDAHNPESGMGPIHEAAEKGNVEVAKLLIERGANLNASRGFVESTPLRIAAGAGKVEMVKLLLKSGADPNARSGHFSPLGSAAFAGHKEVVKLLLDAGAQIDYAGNAQGRTAVMWAAERGKNDVVELLAVEGADLTLKDEDGATAIAVAEAVGNQDAADTLRVVGGTVGKRAPLSIISIFDKGPAGVKQWLDRGGNPNAWDPQLQRTPLDYAVGGPLPERNRAEITKLLLENGADAKRATGIVASAVYAGRDPAFLNLLVTHGADVNGKGWRRGYTALLVAAEFGSAEQVKYLLSKGADVNARLDSGEDAIALATKAKKPQSVAVLREAKKAGAPASKTGRK